jgi:hypothetical protein
MLDTFTLETGTGFWDPIVWIIVFIVAFLIALAIWLLGEKGYRPGTQQVKPYLSGNVEPEKADVHMRAGNLYWGFTEAMKGYYSRLVPLHTGMLNDYVLWFLGVMALVFVIVGVAA